jgi:Domain of unknown function (DUF4440)
VQCRQKAFDQRRSSCPCDKDCYSRRKENPAADRSATNQTPEETMKIRLLGLVRAGNQLCFADLAQQKGTVDPKIVEQLNAISTKYDEAVNNNDATAVAALYTEDAVFVTDRGPIYGRQAIEKWYADVFKAWHPKKPHRQERSEFSSHCRYARQYSVKWRME